MEGLRWSESNDLSWYMYYIHLPSSWQDLEEINSIQLNGRTWSCFCIDIHTIAVLPQVLREVFFADIPRRQQHQEVNPADEADLYGKLH